MEHLFATTVQAYRLKKTADRGAMQVQWLPLTGGRFRCRLDLQFVRPGKDVLPPAEAGKAPDRTGVMIWTANVPIRASDRIVVTEGPNYPGTFELRAIPDTAQAYSAGHHKEVQVFEVAQQVATS